MPVLQELHSWSAAAGGFQCTTCSAFLPQNILAANTPSIITVDDSAGLNDDNNQILQQAYAKAGLP